MTENDKARRSISVLVDEVAAGYSALGLPLDESDYEIIAIVDRLERRLRRRMRKGEAA